MAIAIVYLATGLTWAGRSLLGVVADPEYWEPVTTIDWVAVWTYSLAFALTAVAVPLLARDARAGRMVGLAAAVVAIAAAAAALGNVVEDAFDQSAWSTVYVVGAIGTLLGMLALAGLLLAQRRLRAAAIAFLLVAGLALTTWGLGFLALVGMALAASDRLRPPTSRSIADT